MEAILQFVADLVVIIAATMVAGWLAVRLGQPSVLGQLLVGIIIGPALLGWIEPSAMIETFSYIGVILLMFFAGLETDLSELNRNRVASVNVALGGIIAPFAGGYAFSILWGFEQHEAMFIGLLLSATSVSISVQTFKELNQLKSKESATVLGAALVDDIAVVILLAVLMSFFTGGDINIGKLLGTKALFFGVSIVIAWFVVPWLIRNVANLKIHEPVVKASVILCFAFAWFAESLAVAGIIGAFIAGVAISRTPYQLQVNDQLEPIAAAIFTPVFFVSIGLQVSFNGLDQIIWFALLLSLLAVITKWIGAGFGARLSGFNNRSSLVIGAGMISRGEIALIIASIGLTSGLLSKDFYTGVIFAVIVSTVVTPPLLKYLVPVAPGEPKLSEELSHLEIERKSKD
jgi:monovalent cation:proton antiporter-2 (CPA2) family protein